MSKADVQKDLDTIKGGVLRFMDLSEPPEEARKGGKEGDKAHKQWQKDRDAFMVDEIPKMIEAGFRIVGGLFVNLQRIADSIEDQAGAG